MGISQIVEEGGVKVGQVKITPDMSNQIDVETIIPHLFNEQIPWMVERRFGSFIQFEFGKRRFKTRTFKYKENTIKTRNDTGTLGLYIQFPAWRLERGSNILTASEDEHPSMDRELARLIGKKIVSMHCQPLSHDLTVTFADGRVLRTFAMYMSEKKTAFDIFIRDTSTIVVAPNYIRLEINPPVIPNEKRTINLLNYNSIIPHKVISRSVTMH